MNNEITQKKYDELCIIHGAIPYNFACCLAEKEARIAELEEELKKVEKRTREEIKNIFMVGSVSRKAIEEMIDAMTEEE